jgi:hypothetical protein
MELHGLGPIKLFDTPGAGRARTRRVRARECTGAATRTGVDEGSELGQKKRAKALDVLRASNIAVMLVATRSDAAVRACLHAYVGLRNFMCAKFMHRLDLIFCARTRRLPR